MNRILIIVEHFAGKIRETSFELATATGSLSASQPMEITAVILGEDVGELAAEFAERSGLDTIDLIVPGLKSYRADIYKQALLNLFDDFSFSVCMTSHSTQSLDLIPALAVNMGAGMITGVEAIELRSEGPVFRRSISSGKLVTTVRPRSFPLFLTVQPGSFSVTKNEPGKTGDVIHRSYSPAVTNIRYLGTKSSAMADSDLSEAKVIIAAGRGIGDAENLELIEQLASLFPKSAIAGSRPLCDLGWLEYRRQVGVTGATVAPELYLACGISGASQHVTGMKGSGLIVSINIDPNAAINTVSDFCVVEDLQTFIPVLIEENQKR